MPGLIKFANRKNNLLLWVALLSVVFLSYYPASSEVKPPDKFPTLADTLQVVEKITFKIDLYLWQNFMPGPEESGPPFYISLQLSVKNNDKKKVVGLKAIELTLYPENSKKPFHTFRLVSEDPDAPVEIKPTQEEYFTFTNDRREIFSPKLDQDSKFYARIKVVWNGKERILTSPVVGVESTY